MAKEHECPLHPGMQAQVDRMEDHTASIAKSAAAMQEAMGAIQRANLPHRMAVQETKLEHMERDRRTWSGLMPAVVGGVIVGAALLVIQMLVQ